MKFNIKKPTPAVTQPAPAPATTPTPQKPNPFAKLSTKPAAQSKPNPSGQFTTHGLKGKLASADKSTRGITRESDEIIRELAFAKLEPIRRDGIADFVTALRSRRTGDGLANTNPFHSDTRPQLDSNQRLACDRALLHQYTNLVGAAGSGKTFTTREVISTLIDAGAIRKVGKLSSRDHGSLTHLGLGSNHYNLACCAFTGMAVKNIRKNMPRELAFNCSTIHKLLDYGPEILEMPATDNDVKLNRAAHVGQMIEKRIFKPRITSLNPLPLDFLLIDEASMLGLNLAEQLFTALPSHTRILIVGDLAQLKPVMDTSLQPFALAEWPRTELTNIYRQKDGDIIDAATKIRHGHAPASSPNFKPFLLDKSPVKAQKQVASEIRSQFDANLYDPFQDICLSPWNVQEVGGDILNTLTRTIVNPRAKRKLIKTQTSNKTYSVGDRICITKNNPDLNVFNGMLGTIVSITKSRPLDYDDESEADFSTQPGQVEVNTNFLEAAFSDSLADAKAQADGKSRDQHDEGSGSRAASHVLTVVMDQHLADYDEKWVRNDYDDDSNSIINNKLPDPMGAAIKLTTSSQIENTSLAYWVTVNRSQGSGFRNVILAIHDQHAVSLCNEMLYTGVTRTMNRVTVMTTKYAIGKCLNRFTYKGTTLDEKVDNYLTDEARKGRHTPEWLPEANEWDIRDGANATAPAAHIEIVDDIPELEAPDEIVELAAEPTPEPTTKPAPRTFTFKIKR